MDSLILGENIAGAFQESEEIRKGEGVHNPCHFLFCTRIKRFHRRHLSAICTRINRWSYVSELLPHTTTAKGIQNEKQSKTTQHGKASDVKRTNGNLAPNVFAQEFSLLLPDYPEQKSFLNKKYFYLLPFLRASPKSQGATPSHPGYTPHALVYAGRINTHSLPIALTAVQQTQLTKCLLPLFYSRFPRQESEIFDKKKKANCTHLLGIELAFFPPQRCQARPPGPQVGNIFTPEDRR